MKMLKYMTESEIKEHVLHQLKIIRSGHTVDTVCSILIIFQDDGTIQYGITDIPITDINVVPVIFTQYRLQKNLESILKALATIIENPPEEERKRQEPTVNGAGIAENKINDHTKFTNVVNRLNEAQIEFLKTHKITVSVGQSIRLHRENIVIFETNDISHLRTCINAFMTMTQDQLESLFFSGAWLNRDKSATDCGY